MSAPDAVDSDSTFRRLHRKLNPCETPGCAGNCAYAWSCHNTRLGKIGFFWPGIALLAIVLGIIILR